MATAQSIKYLKLEGCNKVQIFPADQISGVYYEENNYDKGNDDKYVDEEQDYEYDNELEDEQAYDRSDQEKIDKILLNQAM